MRKIPISPFILLFLIVIFILVSLTPDYLSLIFQFHGINSDTGLTLFVVFLIIFSIILIVLSVFEIMKYISGYWNEDY